MAKTQILQVAVDKNTERLLRAEAKRDDLPLSAVIRRAISSYLAAQSQEKAA